MPGDRQNKQILIIQVNAKSFVKIIFNFYLVEQIFYVSQQWIFMATKFGYKINSWISHWERNMIVLASEYIMLMIYSLSPVVILFLEYKNCLYLLGLATSFLMCFKEKCKKRNIMTSSLYYQYAYLLAFSLFQSRVC